jgi:hypothetical protein
MFTKRKTGLPGFFIVHKVNTHLYHVISGFLKWWVPQELDGLSMENPNLKWMMTRGTPISGNLHIYIYQGWSMAMFDYQRTNKHRMVVRRTKIFISM